MRRTDRREHPIRGPIRSRKAGPAHRARSRAARRVDGAVTLEDGLARFECTIYRVVDAGDHVVVFLELHAVDQSDTSGPLVFHRSSFGRLVG